MKKIFLAITLIISIALLSGCGMLQMYEMYKSENETLTAKDDSKLETPAPSATSDPQTPVPSIAPQTQTPIPDKTKEVPSPSPSVAVVNTPSPEPIGEGPFTIDETYLNILHATYADMAEVYGDKPICSSLEIGIYSFFDEARVFCRFEITDIERFYEDNYDFQMKDYEFDFVENGYADRQYIGETFGADEFYVSYIEIYGEGVDAFFGYDGLILLSEVNEQFGWVEDDEINYNEMYEIYESAWKEYGEYQIYFNLTPYYDDFLIDSVNIMEKSVG